MISRSPIRVERYAVSDKDMTPSEIKAFLRWKVRVDPSNEDEELKATLKNMKDLQDALDRKKKN